MFHHIWNALTEALTLLLSFLKLPLLILRLIKAVWHKKSFKEGWHHFLEVNIKAALDKAYGRTQQMKELQPFDRDDDQTKYVIFSDQHRGARNGADDFQRSERAYNAALAYYYQMGYSLIVLGDAEELWEERPKNVRRAYPHSLALEAKFHNDNRYFRVFGNHDDIWKSEWAVGEYLQSTFKPRRLKVYESLKIPVQQDDQRVGEFFLIHGHQGSLESDYVTLLSRLFVRFIWKHVQRLTKKRLNTPATHWQMRKLNNIAMYHWAVEQENVVLITGHTHKPVFEPRQRETFLKKELEELSPGNAFQIAELSAALEWERTLGAKIPVGEEDEQQTIFCYFNSGCCSYSDGDVTGLEIVNGRIRLVRWPDDAARPLPKQLDEATLIDVFSSLNPKLVDDSHLERMEEEVAHATANGQYRNPVTA